LKKLDWRDKIVEEITVPGTIIIEDEVVASIAGQVAREVEGVYRLGTSSIRRTLAERLGGAEPRTRGIDAAVGTKEAAIDFIMTVIYGYNILEVASQVRRCVAEKVSNLTGLVVKEINIDINDIYFPERGRGIPE
jgi:uncharacterized alkaline shock family protein YloU